MCSLLLSSAQAESGLAKTIDMRLNQISTVYRRVLEWVLRHPSLLVAMIVFIVAVTYFCYQRITQEFAPTEDRGIFMVNMKGPEGASFESSQKYMREIERELMPLIENGDAKRINVRTPGSFGNPNSFNDGRASVVLEDFGKRRSQFEIMAEFRKKIAELAGVSVFPTTQGGLSQSAGEPVQFVIGGSTYEELREWRDIIFQAARENPRLLNIDADYNETKPQIKVMVDKERAATMGVTMDEIGHTLETFFGSRRVTTYLDRGEEYEVILQGQDADRNNATDLDNVYVRSASTRALIPLSNIVSLQEVADASALNRYNRLRSITIKANLLEGYTLGEALDFLDTVVKEKIPQKVQVSYRGESREFKESQGAIVFVLIFSLLVVYFVLAAQFESFIHPVTILLTVPLAIAGALFGLWIMGNTLNIFSKVGLIMLVGLVAKNGILIVEFANQLRDAGHTLREAILRSAELRLRPIAMTAIATVSGAIPLMMGSGAGSENRITLGIVIVFGVTVSTVLALFVVPVAYNFLGKFTSSPQARGKQIDVESEEKTFRE